MQTKGYGSGGEAENDNAASILLGIRCAKGAICD